ncbi:unnamed protein product, partial [Amoebophrya sp. A25]|eukprot:GSA25T00003439001.1
MSELRYWAHTKSTKQEQAPHAEVPSLASSDDQTAPERAARPQRERTPNKIPRGGDEAASSGSTQHTTMAANEEALRRLPTITPLVPGQKGNSSTRQQVTAANS